MCYKVIELVIFTVVCATVGPVASVSGELGTLGCLGCGDTATASHSSATGGTQTAAVRITLCSASRSSPLTESVRVWKDMMNLLNHEILIIDTNGDVIVRF